MPHCSCGKFWSDYGYGECSVCHPVEPLKHSFSTVDEIRPHLRLYRKKHPRKEGESTLYRGLSASDDMYYPFVKKNIFSSVAKPVESDWELERTYPNDWILRCMFNPDQHHIKRKLPEGHDDDDWVMTHDNGGRPFVVYISPDKTIASVYRKPSNAFLWGEDWDHENENGMRDYYHELVIRLDIDKVWIYKEEEEKGSWDRGNSLLVLRKDGSYVFIGDLIYSFRTEEPIEEYTSEVGHSDVPYPVALSSTKAYFVLSCQWVSIEDIKDKNDPNATFYDYGFPKEKKHDFSYETICKRILLE